MAKKSRLPVVFTDETPTVESVLNERFDPVDFAVLEKDGMIFDEPFKGEPISFLKDVWMRFRKNKTSIAAGIIILLIVFMAIVAPIVSPYLFTQIFPSWSRLPPRIPVLENFGIADGCVEMSLQKRLLPEYEHAITKTIREYIWQYRGQDIPMVTVRINQYKMVGADDYYFYFGTDIIGRDLWTRLWRGTRISLIIGVVSVLINVMIGVTYGAICGYYGGKIDMLLQRVIEILGGIPFLVLAILFVLFMGSGIMTFIFVLVITGWIGMSRMIRAQFYRYKNQEYVLASRTMGSKDGRLIFFHILPNAIGPIITQAMFAVPMAIFSEAFLSYIGLGIRAPEPSIGILLAEGQKSLIYEPYMLLFPAIVVSILMLSFNMFSNGLRDAFDPRMRGL